MLVFASMGMLAALAGIMFASRLRSATPQAGQLFELDCHRGGFYRRRIPRRRHRHDIGIAHRRAGVHVLTNGMNLMGTDIAIQYIVRGLVLAIAVIFDVTTRRTSR